MVDVVDQFDPQSKIIQLVASGHTSVTAGGAGNAVQVVGLTVDREANGVPLTARFGILWQAALAAGKTLSLAVAVEQSPDGVNWSSYNPPAYPVVSPGVVATGPTGGGTVNGLTVVQIRVSSAARYVRFDYTPTLSATATDTALIMAFAELHGFMHLPPP